jgi:hypothetical protein
MKSLKLGLIALCGMLLTFSACKKDKDTTPNNSFLVGSANYACNVGFYSTYGTDEADLIFFNKLPISDATGMNSVYIAFGGGVLPAAGTYTYKSGTPDIKKNFSEVAVTYDGTYSSATATFTSGTTYDSDKYDATGSTISVSINGSTYTVVYNLKFTDGNKKITTINGQYSGALTKLN